MFWFFDKEISFGEDIFSYPRKLKLNEVLSTQEKTFEYLIQTNSNGETVIILEDQVSGVALPNLIFNLLDENNNPIDGSYAEAVGSSIILAITKNTTLSSNFVITSSTTDYLLGNQYFNVTGLVITGVPGTRIELQVSSSSIEADSSNAYRIIL